MEKGNRVRRVEKANRLAEQRYLDRNKIVESEFSHNGISAFMDIHKDGTFSDDDKKPVEDEEAVNENRARIKPVDNSTAGQLGQPTGEKRARIKPVDNSTAGQLGQPTGEKRARVAPKENPTEGLDEAMMTEVDMDLINAAGDWITGGGMINVGGESIPKNLATLIMGIMPAAAATGFIVNFWDEIKAKIGGGDMEEAKGAKDSRPPVQKHNERPATPDPKDRTANANRDRR